MPIDNLQRYLVAYSAVVTCAFALTVYAAFERPVQSAARVVEFDRIRAHRIDLVEPDGTTRLIVSNRDAYPGSFFHNREIARPDRRESAGMLFLDDEGNENGGLLFSGNSLGGKPSSGGHISFDNYQQDQVVALDASQENGRSSSSLRLLDQPSWLLTPALIDTYLGMKAMPAGPAKDKAQQAFAATHPLGHSRAALVNAEDGSVSLTLADRKGRARLVLKVASDGTPGFQLLDAAGRVMTSKHP